MQFHIQNMVCGACARSVTRAIQALDAQAHVQADPPSRTVTVTTTLSRAQIEAALRAAQFAPD